jgi:hypothetical protein
MLAHGVEIDAMRLKLVDAIGAGAVSGLLKQDFQFPDVSGADVAQIYEESVVKETSAGRKYYDLIRLSDWCPQCWEREVDEVDHYLPKSVFHGLVVAFENLTPICMKCNRKKTNAYPTVPGKVPFHPYYEDYDHLTWLEASVGRTPQPHVFFGVSSKMAGPGLADRMQFHLQRFKLDEFYGKLMARAISSAVSSWVGVDEATGNSTTLSELSVKSDCLYRSREAQARSNNSWGAAGWRACGESSWFCKGGFLEFTTT